ncbi:MIB/HERC2 domain-containing protein [Durusdinium trenchii]|uniref:MIB/HERC2 domain-containing protein n=1 Tax=Durusdinium trenchii TaxID=1381693 RepID=A0ABP0QXT5_9DINO
MKEAAACKIEWQLAPFLQGFCEEAFAQEVRSFVRRHASAFGRAPDDGYPLHWTQLHQEYVQLFERQLKSVVQEEGFSLEDFRAHIAELREVALQRRPEEYLPGCEPSYIPPSPGIRVAEFWSFLEALTASEDFQKSNELALMAKPSCYQISHQDLFSLSGYFLISVSRAYRDDPDFELFDLMLAGAVHPSIMQDQKNLLRELQGLVHNCADGATRPPVGTPWEPVFMFSSHGCAKGEQCRYCHQPHPAVESSRPVKLWREQMKEQVLLCLLAKDMEEMHQRLQKEARPHPYARKLIEGYLNKVSFLRSEEGVQTVFSL